MNAQISDLSSSQIALRLSEMHGVHHDAYLIFLAVQKEFSA